MTTGKQVYNGLYSPGPCLWILNLHDHPEPKFYIFWPFGWWNHGKRSMIWDVFGRYLKAPQIFPMCCCNKERRRQQIQGNSTRLKIVISFTLVLFIQHGTGKSTISTYFLNGIHPIKKRCLVVAMSPYWGGKSLQKYRYFCMASNFDPFKPRFLSLFNWGQGLIVAKSGVMMSSWANSASSFPWFSGWHCAMRGKKAPKSVQGCWKNDLCKYDPTKFNLTVQEKSTKPPGSKGSKFLKLNMDVIGILNITTSIFQR